LDLRQVPRRERLLAYWLLRAYRDGLQPLTIETRQQIWSALCHLGYDPATLKARRLLARKARTRP
jgi:hypothetical protein